MTTARLHERTLLPVVDLFAGPGGLGEGFSALDHDRVRFDVVLSVEKDPAAHRTLRLRSLFRHLRTVYQREAYYLYLKGEISSEDLFAACPEAANKAEARCLHLELGSQKTKRVYAQLDRLVGAAEPWVLVGGLPCQAYSVVGRSRLANSNGRSSRRTRSTSCIGNTCASSRATCRRFS